MKIKVSIIIPVYNNEKYIEMCIKSLLNQSLKEIEFIFVNDGSDDGCENIIKKYRDLDNRIKLINQKNNGVSAARNKGLYNAEGEYIGFVDCDDTINKFMYEDLYNNAIKHDLDIVMCSALIMNRKGIYRKESTNIRKNIIIHNIVDNEEEFIEVAGSVWKGLYKSTLLKDNNLSFNKALKMSEDKIFNIEALYYCKNFMYLDEFYYNYSYNLEGAVRSYRNDMLETIIKAKGIQDKLLNKYHYTKKLKDLYNKQFMYTIIQCINNEMKKRNKNIFTSFKDIKNILEDKSISMNIDKINIHEFKSIKEILLYIILKYKILIFIYYYCRRNNKEKK